MDFARYASHLQVFVDVARYGSFSAVARKHGVAVSSIVRRIDALEADLQAKLFVRSTRVLALTDAGAKLLSHAQDVINRLMDARSEIGALNEKPEGILRVSCLPTFGRLRVIPVVATLLESWPDLHIELALTERLADPATERCDLAIRIGEQRDSGLFASTIGSQRWVICASPSYLERYGYPQTMHAVADHRRIGKARESAGVGWSRIAGNESALAENTLFFRCDDFEAQRQAALSSLGLAMLPDWVVASDIAIGQLILLFGGPAWESSPIVILRAIKEMPPKMRVFIEAMQKTGVSKSSNL